ncbi:MAG: hypothetical protein WAO20_01430 [Acidobacteriota bacterium]
MHRNWLGPLTVCALVALATVVARSDEPWRGKAPERWTLEDAEKVLQDSPWVRNFQLGQFAVRIRSAEPVRLALVRRRAALPDAHIRSVQPPDPGELHRSADSLSVPGRLLISIHPRGPDAVDALNRQSLRTFRPHAYLELTASGQRIRPIAYEAPWQNELKSAVFQFPRPSLEEAGERMTFVARFGLPKIVTLEADFDLADLMWQGHIEY